MGDEASHEGRARLRSLWRPALGLALFGVALFVLDRQLEAHTLDEVRDRLRAIPKSALALAVGLTALSYGILTTFDALAIRHLDRRLAYPRVALTSFVAYVFSIDLGLSVFGSSAIRYRLYSMWGLSVGDVAGVVAFTTLTFWLGLLALGGVLLTFTPLPLGHLIDIPDWPFATSRPIGVALLIALAVYVGVTLRRRTPVRIGDVAIRLPRPGMTAAQITVASADWIAASSVLFVLLPEAPGLEAPTFVAIFMAAQVLGVASTVPAGLGVFEGLMLALLGPTLPAPEVLGALVAYRIVYYVMPIFGAVALMGAVELAQRRHVMARLGAVVGEVAEAVVPRLLALALGVAGLLLVWAGVAPTSAWHAVWMRPFLGTPLVELSHLLGVAAGIGLILLARGIRLRVDAAWSVSFALVALGSAASVLRGAHWLLATALIVLALALVALRPHFDRRSALLPHALPGEWAGLVVVALAGAGWQAWVAAPAGAATLAGWGEFDADAEAARAIRAVGLGGLLLVGFFVWRLTRPAAPRPERATASDLDRAAEIVAQAGRADAHLALLGDKSLLFGDDDEDALLMYGVSGRSWVVMGDPIGPPAARRALAWRLAERADEAGGWPVFYEVGTDDLPTYLDLGLSLHKLGEDARVPLADFSLEGPHRRGLRQVVRRCERDGARFEVVAREDVPPLLESLEAVSQAWLARKHTREKGFSLGAFDRDYLARQPVAVVRVGDEIVAFANVWAGREGTEISPDLMRYDPDRAPPSVMEYLFVELMLYGRARGHAWFGLGMAPLAGLSRHPLAPVWNRIGGLLYRHGEHFYNFQGLRQYKAKFDPEWSPRYLASPGGLDLPRVLADVASLVSGGLRGVVSR